MQFPKFEPLARRQEFCVLVTYTDGAKSRVGHFATDVDARRWIDQEAGNWLRARMEDKTPAIVRPIQMRVSHAH
jgi:hypothetical protein